MAKIIEMTETAPGKWESNGHSSEASPPLSSEPPPRSSPGPSSRPRRGATAQGRSENVLKNVAWPPPAHLERCVVCAKKFQNPDEMIAVQVFGVDINSACCAKCKTLTTGFFNLLSKVG